MSKEKIVITTKVKDIENGFHSTSELAGTTNEICAAVETTINGFLDFMMKLEDTTKIRCALTITTIQDALNNAIEKELKIIKEKHEEKQDEDETIH